VLLVVRHAIVTRANAGKTTATIRRRVIMFLPSSGLIPILLKELQNPAQP
jgi:hypothetical protein